MEFEVKCKIRETARKINPKINDFFSGFLSLVMKNPSNTPNKEIGNK
tara:strand:+ start:625 stop:765 length:141 start_codon:yes stop_codon:yes gene_type:complete